MTRIQSPVALRRESSHTLCFSFQSYEKAHGYAPPGGVTGLCTHGVLVSIANVISYSTPYTSTLTQRRVDGAWLGSNTTSFPAYLSALA